MINAIYAIRIVMNVLLVKNVSNALKVTKKTLQRLNVSLLVVRINIILIFPIVVRSVSIIAKNALMGAIMDVFLVLMIFFFILINALKPVLWEPLEIKLILSVLVIYLLIYVFR